MFKIKRLMAFCLDLLLVTILTVCITKVDYINPYMNEVEEATKAYNEVLNDYSSLSNEDEIEEFINNIQDKLYDYEHTQIYVNMWYIIFYIGYFVIFAYFTDGQTLGKKLMSIKVVKEDGSKVGLFGLLKRSITNGSSFFMGMNLLNLTSLILTISMKPNRTYVLLFMGAMVICTIMEIANIIIYIKNKDNKCLNDFVSGTKVIRVE